ncbi:hypothetical protein, partial [Enterococcus sp. HMSC065H03]
KAPENPTSLGISCVSCSLICNQIITEINIYFKNILQKSKIRNYFLYATFTNKVALRARIFRFKTFYLVFGVFHWSKLKKLLEAILEPFKPT